MAAGKYVFVPRRKNMQALSEYGFTIADAKDEIIGLVVGNYYPMCRKTPCFSYGDIRHFHRIYVSN